MLNYHVYLFPKKIIKVFHILLADFDKYTHGYGIIYVIMFCLKKIPFSRFQKSHTFPF